jgi:hypothetical protein
VGAGLAPIWPALVALVVVGHRRLWRATRIVVTIAHEGGHAVVALLCGRRLSGIRLHSDTSGLTVSRGRPRGPGMVATALAGYPAPSLLGLVVAGMVVAGTTRLVLATGIVALLATLWFVRNLYGWFAVLATGAVVGLVAWYGTHPVRVAFCAGLAWFLLLGGLRAVFELPGARRRWPGTDADQLAALTRVAPFVWIAIFTIVSGAALVCGAWLLSGDVLR